MDIISFSAPRGTYFTSILYADNYVSSKCCILSEIIPFPSTKRQNTFKLSQSPNNQHAVMLNVTTTCNSFELKLQINQNSYQDNTGWEYTKCVKQHCFQIVHSQEQLQDHMLLQRLQWLLVHTCTRSMQIRAQHAQLPVVTDIMLEYFVKKR